MRFWASSLVALAVLGAALALPGCGSRNAVPSAGTDSNRYFGDLPGQEATKAAISRDDCRALRQGVERDRGLRLTLESEPSPPSSRCLLRAGDLRVSVYLDAAHAARQRYSNRIVEQLQFYGTEPAKRPHPVAGVGDRSAHEHSASWIPALGTLWAVRGNRWLTVAYSARGLSRPQREAAAAALARQAFKLTAR